MTATGVHEVKFHIGDGPIEMKVFVGNGQIGAFTVTEHDQDGRYRRDITNQTNEDEEPDQFEISNSPAEFDGKRVGWLITIGSPSDSPGQLYLSRISFLQGGQDLDGSPIEEGGVLQGQQQIFGFARLQAV